MTKELVKKIFLAAGLTIILLISFQYASLADFPIGHDAGHHVAVALKIEKSGFFNFQVLKSTIYPIPLIIFSLFHKISGIAWPQLFLYTICLFLFLTAMTWNYFTTKVVGNWQIGVTSGIFLASSRWLSDALRIGFLAEVWGWLVFILCSYFLVKRKLWLLVIFLIVLFLSHPLVAAVFLLMMFLYSIVILFSAQKEDKLFLAKIYSFLILLGVGILIFCPEKINFLTNIISSSYLEGARSLKTIMIDSDTRRILLYLIAILGLIKSISWWSKNEIKYLLVLLFGSIILSQLYLFGINLWVFRFYPYFEMAISLLAAIGLYYLLDLAIQIIPERGRIYYKSIFLIFMVLVLIWPNLGVNKSITVWQADNLQLMATCPPADRTVFIWLANHTPENALFLSPVKWGAWLGPLTDRKVLETDYIFHSDKTSQQFNNFVKGYQVDYIFLSAALPANSIIDHQPAIYHLVYQYQGSRVYQVNRQLIKIGGK